MERKIIKKGIINFLAEADVKFINEKDTPDKKIKNNEITKLTLNEFIKKIIHIKKNICAVIWYPAWKMIINGHKEIKYKIDIRSDVFSLK